MGQAAAQLSAPRNVRRFIFAPHSVGRIVAADVSGVEGARKPAGRIADRADVATFEAPVTLIWIAGTCFEARHAATTHHAPDRGSRRLADVPSCRCRAGTVEEEQRQQRSGHPAGLQWRPDHHEGLPLRSRENESRRRSAIRDTIPRGSSTAIARPAATTTGQAVQPYNPPRITTPGDRATSAIHSYPLNKGLGNNPTDQQMYIRQNSN
jgi:hypothetical protein